MTKDNYNIKKETNIYYLCPIHLKVFGGVNQIFIQANELKKLGFNAKVVLEFNPSNFKKYRNDLLVKFNYNLIGTFFNINSGLKRRVLNIYNKICCKILQIIHYEKFVSFELADIIVIPEVHIEILERISSVGRVVIFNQNSFLTFNNTLVPTMIKNYYNSKNVEAVVTVSNYSLDFIKNWVRYNKVYLLKYYIDENLFYAGNKKKQIAFMSRKLDHHCKTIVGVLHDLLLNTNWELKEIKDANRSEVSRILSESKLFLSTSFEEGFGLPVAEAMISECIIVGYDGYG